MFKCIRMIAKDVSKIYSLFENALSPCEGSLDENLLHEKKNNNNPTTK
jgi:hypothetical protein